MVGLLLELSCDCCRESHWSAVSWHLSSWAGMPVLTIVMVGGVVTPAVSEGCVSMTTGSGMNLLDIAHKKWSSKALEVSICTTKSSTFSLDCRHVHQALIWRPD